MATNLPDNQTKQHFDGVNDDPKQARQEFADNVDRFNALKGALGNAARLSPGEGLETVAQGGGTPDDLRVKIKADALIVRDSDGLSIPIANQAQAQAGADNATAMTPLRTGQAILALAPAPSTDAGAVGTYALLRVASGSQSTERAAGTTLAGSSLEYTHVNASQVGGSPSGTWRLMGYINDSSINANNTSVWVRIS